jgi:hypothetical protein
MPRKVTLTRVLQLPLKQATYMLTKQPSVRPRTSTKVPKQAVGQKVHQLATAAASS